MHRRLSSRGVPLPSRTTPRPGRDHLRPGGAHGVAPFAVLLPPAVAAASPWRLAHLPFPVRVAPGRFHRVPAARSFVPRSLTHEWSRSRLVMQGTLRAPRSVSAGRARPSRLLGFFPRAVRTSPVSSLFVPARHVTALGFGSSLRCSGVGRHDTRDRRHGIHPAPRPSRRPPLWAAPGPVPLVGFVGEVMIAGRTGRPSDVRHAAVLRYTSLSVRVRLQPTRFLAGPFSGWEADA
jgi:hypothetical protein